MRASYWLGTAPCMHFAGTDSSLCVEMSHKRKAGAAIDALRLPVPLESKSESGHVARGITNALSRPTHRGGDQIMMQGGTYRPLPTDEDSLPLFRTALAEVAEATSRGQRHPSLAALL